MSRNSELLKRIIALQEENDGLRYQLTDDPREAIWLKLKAVTYDTGPSLISDVAWAASSVVREGKIPREKMVEYLLGRDDENTGDK